MDLIVLIIVGLISGWLAGYVMKGSGYGLIGDLALGVLGAVVGGWLLGLVAPTTPPSGFVVSVIVASVGAVVLIAVVRALRGQPTSPR